MHDAQFHRATSRSKVAGVASVAARARPHLARWLEPGFFSDRAILIIRIFININGAAGAAYFAVETLRVYLNTHHLIGAAFFVVQMWVVIAYLIRRPARKVSRRLGDWLLAFGGTFGGVLFLPVGDHPHWGISAGLDLQLIGLAIAAISFLTLGRSFGFAAADRGLVLRGPYGIVRHPIYASYLLLGTGYVLQSISLRNVLVMVFVFGCNVGRCLVEERLLSANGDYDQYRARVPWRLVPGVW
ncbi:MAG TPA: isoprenylcysteine carboxylmethyltransferase family protein [Acidimicrobiales bacterium]|nr:isoprenylcysteine carboxylmethyltransferase family protein [Acidimicrobiales bacterium]